MNDIDENEIQDTAPTARDAMNALVSGNSLEFNEIMQELIRDRAADYVNAARDVIAQDAFGLGDIENDGEDEELEDEELDVEDEESEASEEND